MDLQRSVLIICSISGAVLLASADTESCVQIKSREEWGALPPKEVRYQVFPVRNVVICHTVTPKCNSFQACCRQLRAIQAHHQNEKDFNDIAYNFMIANDGTIFEGVGWHKAGTHTRNHNNVTLGVAFIGDFENELPSMRALYAAKNLLDCGVHEGELDQGYRLFGHRQLTQTQSPGSTLYREIQTWDHWTRQF